MTCTCPKCKAEFEFDVTAIPAEGSFDKCSACNVNLVIRKESFAKRALYKSSEIACAECGSPPGISIYCENCHAIYPEILLIETSSATKKQLGKILASLNLLRNLKLTATAKSHKEGFSPTPASGKTKGKGVKLGSPLQVALTLLLILGVVAAGGYFWYQDKVATEYSENYVKAIMGMKSARDFEIKTSNSLAGSWKAGGVATLAEKEVKLLASSRKDVDTLMKRIGKVPPQFTASNEAIIKLNNSFGKLHAAVTDTSGTSDIYAVTVRKNDDEFLSSAKALKAGLAGKLADIFNESARKYKTLQDL